MMSREDIIADRKQPVNDTTLSRESWKIFQIMAEFVEGFERLASIRPSVSVFGSTRIRSDHPYYKLGERIGRTLSDSGFSVVTGGGPGLMEAVNKGACKGKSPSIGLNIQLKHAQPSNQYQDISLHFRHFFSRKVMFVKYASAHVVLPGGFGTLDELMEILTLAQTSKIPRIPIVLVHSEYWRPMVDWFRTKLISEGMIDPTHLVLFKLADEPDEVVQILFDHYSTRSFEFSQEEREALLEL